METNRKPCFIQAHGLRKKLLHEDKQRDNYYNHETKIQPVETNRKPHLIWLMDIEKESPSLEMTRETIIQPEDKCTTNGDKQKTSFCLARGLRKKSQFYNHETNV